MAAPQQQPAAAIPPFHLALPTHDIAAARHFYGEVLVSHQQQEGAAAVQRMLVAH